MFASKIAARGHSKVGEAAQGTVAVRWTGGARSDEALSDATMLEATPHRLSWGFGKVSVQAKLAVGTADDPLEREADTVADRVMRMPDSGPTSDVVRSMAPVAAPEVEGVLGEPGRPLGATTRDFFEPRFGWDFSSVRVHTGPQAERAAESVRARAFALGKHVVFGAGQFAPEAGEGRRLMAHELAHVVQQSGGTGPAIRRKVILSGTEMDAKARKAFIKAHKWTNTSRATAIMQDMAEAADAFDFADDHELQTELIKRSSTVQHMEESQESVGKIPGDKRSAFGYPFSGASALYGPRVNYAAQKYWEPAVPDGYARRTDKVKNQKLQALPRHERCTVYGDQCGGYQWKLTADGEKDPYHAIANLFVPQQPHKRSLIHCDYLISLVNMMSLADAIGATEFNKRVAAYGPAKLILRYNLFTDLNDFNWVPGPGGKSVAKPGLGSAQRIAPSSEADLVIGDHVVFFNHLAYDLINERVGNAWRLENAVLVSRDHGKDVFLGHGSGYLTDAQMREKLAEEYNIVARQALDQTGKAASPHKATHDAAIAALNTRFPKVVNVSGAWKIKGKAGLCTTLDVDVPLRTIKSSEVIGPRNPCDPSKMYVVERPIESAKGKAP